MILRIFRGALAAVTVAISIPYTVAIVSNILNGWPQNKHKYKRALSPKKVLGLNFVIYQMLKDKSKFALLFLKWKNYYRNVDARRVLKNIPYGRNDCCLDVHLLRGKPSSDKTLAPVIIFVYGGSWSSGDRSMYGLLAHQLMSRTNSIVVCPSYSTYPKGYVDDMVQDIADCITWVIDNVDQYGGDPNKIVLMGHSAGAQLCALTILELLRDERISVDSSFKFKPAGGEGLDDELAFAESHYGKLSALYAKREGLGDSSGSSESFAIVSDNGSATENNGSGVGAGGGSNNGLESSTASSIGFLSASMNAEGLESSMTSEGYVKAGVSESQDKEAAEEEAEVVNVDKAFGGGDGVHKTKPEVEASDEAAPPPQVAAAHSGSGGSLGDDEEEAEVEDDSGDNDSIITVRPKDLDRHLTLSELCKSIKAFIGLSGVYSIGDHFQHEFMRGIEDVSCMARAFYGEDHFDRFSPLEIVQRVGRCLSLPQIVLVHGTEDYIVPMSSSSKFADALSKISSNVSLRIIPDCPHYEICLDLMDTDRKFYSHVMNIVMETFRGIS